MSTMDTFIICSFKNKTPVWVEIDVHAAYRLYKKPASNSVTSDFT